MKFVDSYTNKETGVSSVMIKNRQNFYYGKARLHPDDSWSEFTGCRYAEMRAILKALKDEYQAEKQACEECRKFVKAVTQYKMFDPESPSAKAMFKQLNSRIKKVNAIADKINDLEFNLKVSFREQDEISRKIAERKND